MVFSKLWSWDEDLVMEDSHGRYKCPNCKSIYTSSKPITYCICGGKLEPCWIDVPLTTFEDLFKNNPFSVQQK